MENNENIEINIEELTYIVLNAENNYKTLKEHTNGEGFPLYVATASTLTALYRKTKELIIDDVLLYFYADIVRAIIEKDEKHIDDIKEMIKNAMLESDKK